MARSLIRLSGHHRVASVLGAGVLAASLALVGCSSSSPKDGGTIPPVNTAGASTASTTAPAAPSAASASASGAASTGVVTAESLSDPTLGYTVVSIPKDLDDTQTKVLQDFIAYDKVTWRIWFGGGKDTTGIDKVATGLTLQRVVNNASKMREEGQHARPPVRVSISEVVVYDSKNVAQVTMCVDQKQMTMVDSNGNDVTKPEHKIEVPSSTRMTNPDGTTWLATEGRRGQDGECSVD
ncbi:hypothetical protein QU665_08510 [Actinomyces oris]|uniref:Lipoprotein n=1 Tax=Actinomyces oris TaxID=544580 RepID=A0AAW9KWF1_9ACTO|nr:hypothetical protein [Actinomyces oris]MEA1305104.1 hypothetical protein [Actinomyces oris]